jgi:8-oxo-dGTP pyrophosphatase MutT (NUDIX family)
VQEETRSANVSDERWRPSVTVAAVICDGGTPARYLLVEEHTPEGLKLNNPAGHLEPGESPEQGVVREALEETARHFSPTALLGVYLARFQRPGTEGAADEDITYVRFAYSGSVGDELPGRALDQGIERTLWMTLAEVRESAARHRSPLVLQCVADHAAGRGYTVRVVSTHASVHRAG